MRAQAEGFVGPFRGSSSPSTRKSWLSGKARVALRGAALHHTKRTMGLGGADAGVFVLSRLRALPSSRTRGTGTGRRRAEPRPRTPRSVNGRTAPPGKVASRWRNAATGVSRRGRGSQGALFGCRRAQREAARVAVSALDVAAAASAMLHVRREFARRAAGTARARRAACSSPQSTIQGPSILQEPRRATPRARRAAARAARAVRAVIGAASASSMPGCAPAP
jgi:hypothetical protein